MMPVYTHNRGYIVIIVASVAVYCVLLVFNVLAIGVTCTDLFQNRTGDVYSVYYIEITPAGWAFCIWGVIYLWQLAWLMYGVFTIGRTTALSYLYVSPAHLPPIIYLIFIFNNVMNVSWLVLWDRFYPEYALVFLTLTTMSLYVILCLSCRQLHHAAPVLIQEDLERDIWITRVLVHNGIGIYAGWVTIATLLNLDVVLTYSGHVDQSIASTLCLGLLLTIIIVWFFADTTLLDIYVRYLLTPYLAALVALAGSIHKNWDLTKNNSILTSFTLAVTLLFTIIKVITMTIRHKRNPIYDNEQSILSYQPLGNSYSSMSKSYELLT